MTALPGAGYTMMQHFFRRWLGGVERRMPSGTPPKKTLWLESPLLHAYSSTCLWTLDRHWANYVIEKYSLVSKSWLSIGCGTGQLERGLIQQGCVQSIDAFDLNPVSLEQARHTAKTEGLPVHYFSGNANTIVLEREKYDIAIAHNSLHHIENLEHIARQVSDSLKPGGLFIVIEFTGPTRFLWPDHQLALINACLAILPEKYKMTNQDAGTWKKAVTRQSVQGYLDSEPSEAIRSAEIETVLSQTFEILEEKNMGGTILHMLLADIISNFDESKEEDRLVLSSLCVLEKSLIESGAISSDEKFFVCRKRDDDTMAGQIRT